jgi:hypothetical protein
MAKRKPFLLRLDPALLEAMQRWAADEMRSLNGQIEYCLKNSLKNSGRGIKQSEEEERPSKPLPP